MKMKKIKNIKVSKETKVKIIIISIIIFITAIFITNSKFTNYNIIAKTESMVDVQKRLEGDFKIKGHTLDNPNIILNPYGNSPLTALITFETKYLVSPKVTIKGKDKNTTFTHEFESSTQHYLKIYGLYANKENKVTIEYKDDNGKTHKNTISIKTEALPKDMILPTEVKANKSKLQNELYFYTPSSAGYTCAYDVNGDVRWYFTNYALWKIDRLRNGHLLVSTERLINNPYYMTGMYEMDLLGRIYVEYKLEGGYHHDYYEMENGNLLVASDNFKSGKGTVEDYIVELSRETGEVVKEFDLTKVLNMEDGQSENWSSYDWFHNNSVWYDKNTNSITLSGRHQDAVINIDYETSKLNWIIGDPTNWSEEYQKYFFKPKGKGEFEWQWSQHAAMITPEGYVFILDNGNNKSKIKEEYVKAEDSYTRGVMYKIDTDNMTIEQVWEYGKERGSEFYSPYISDVDYLEKNHYIVHSGGIVYVDGKNSNQPAGFSKNNTLVSDTVELLNDKVIFELKLPTNNYRVEKMKLYAANESFDRILPIELGKLGTTKVDKTRIGIPIFSKKINDDYKKYNITLTREKDRLVFKGQFKRNQKINILLYKNGVSKVYNVKVSKKPYTALCVDVFTEEETKNGINVTKYINEDSLKGNYSVYIEIDGTLYNTNEYVKFYE